MILDTSTRTIEIVLQKAITTSQPKIMVDYVDITSSTTTPSVQLSTANSTTAVTILSAPPSGQRKVNFISICNIDTDFVNALVRLNDNGTFYNYTQYTTLPPNSTLQYTDTKGWSVIDAAGNVGVASGSVVDVQIFNGGVVAASGTWTKPKNATYVYVDLIGAGGGGSGGAGNATSTLRGAGGGGGGGARFTYILLASELPAFMSCYAAGSTLGGNGGSTGNGSNAVFGENTYFGSTGIRAANAGFGAPGTNLIAGGGASGAMLGQSGSSGSGSSGGTTNIGPFSNAVNTSYDGYTSGAGGTGGATPVSGGNSTFSGGGGGGGSISATGAAAGNGGQSYMSGGGGGGGGGITAANVVSPGGFGGSTGIQARGTANVGTNAPAAAAINTGTAGANGIDGVMGYCGTGGAGGSGNNTGVGSAGGNGGFPGGGGGGGGAGLTTGGRGGNGAGGRLVVISW